jgi:hypothetical protein
MELTTLFLGALGASLALLLAELPFSGRCKALLPRSLAVGLALPLAVLGGYRSLHGQLPMWPPVDASGFLVVCLPLAAFAISIRSRRIGLAMALAGIGLWIWLGLEPYRTRHWADSQALLRLGGLAFLLVTLAAALQLRLPRQEERWWLPTGLLALLVICALLVGQSSGASALLLGCLGIGVGASAVSCLRVGEIEAMGALAWPLALGAGGLVINGVLYASTPALSAFLLAGAVGLLCIPLPRWRGAAALRLVLVLALGGGALYLGWPEPDPYGAGW